MTATRKSLVPRLHARDLLREGCADAVIFDMDGVLADTEPFHIEAWRRLLENYAGTSPSLDTIRATFGQTNDVIIPKLFAEVGMSLDGLRIEDLSREKERAYRVAARGRLRPLPGVERFLRWLRKRGVRTGIGTSGPEENIRFLLEEFAWRGLFDVLIDRKRFARGKPAPDCFLAAALALRSRPERTLVFEDSTHGLLAARRGGFPAAAVATTLEPQRLRSLARWVFRDFTEIAC